MGIAKEEAKPRGRFIMVSHTMLNSPAFIALPANAQRLFLDLRLKFNGGNNGDINASLAELRHRGWRSPSTLAKSIRHLEALGFIVRTRQTPGVEHGSRICNLYAFTDMEVRAMPHKHVEKRPPTYDYLNHKTLAVCRALVRQATPAKKSTRRKVDRNDSESESCSPSDATVSAEDATADLPNSVAARKPTREKIRRSDKGLAMAHGPPGTA